VKNLLIPLESIPQEEGDEVKKYKREKIQVVERKSSIPEIHLNSLRAKRDIKTQVK